ncbi:hypothetical protein BDV29DRAFT_154119 [Aspergillus leporis]|uniref:PPM-type phosphatase domain-containing protein n=1 Tax=Aspergillus leporis TaxID=41062 RepID=A0A5N5X8G3_9EURO|nr:hypothetical protein BDV29DRAFT_154119 [Aspergillus leporis]
MPADQVQSELVPLNKTNTRPPPQPVLYGSDKVSKHANENIRRFLQESSELEAGRYEEAKAIKKEEEELLEGFRNGEEELATGGSTVALALVNLTKGIMVTGNLGDSHIIMEDYTGANGKATNIPISYIEYIHKAGT